MSDEYEIIATKNSEKLYEYFKEHLPLNTTKFIDFDGEYYFKFECSICDDFAYLSFSEDMLVNYFRRNKVTQVNHKWYDYLSIDDEENIKIIIEDMKIFNY